MEDYISAFNRFIMIIVFCLTCCCAGSVTYFFIWFYYKRKGKLPCFDKREDEARLAFATQDAVAGK